jgi:hypothetical protein
VPLDTSGKGIDVIHDTTSTGAYASVRTAMDNRIIDVQLTGAVSEVSSFSSDRHVEGLALSDGYIFHVNQEAPGSIGRVQTDGGDLQLDWAPTQTSPELVIADGDDVIWTRTNEGVFKKSKTTGVITQLLAGKVGHGGITADTDAIFAVVENEGRVVRIDRATGTAVDVHKGLMDPVGITSDLDAIYFVDRKSGTIYRMTK